MYKLIIFSCLLFSIESKSQCPISAMNLFDDYFLGKKVIHNFMMDTLRKYSDCQRDFLQKMDYYQECNSYDIGYILGEVITDSNIKKAFGHYAITHLTKFNDNYSLMHTISDNFDISLISKEDQILIVESMKKNTYSREWLIFGTPFIKNKSDIDFIKGKNKETIEIIYNTMPNLESNILAEIATVFARLGDKKAIEFLVNYYALVPIEAKDLILPMYTYSKQKETTNLIIDYYNKAPEWQKENIISNHLSRCILELPKDTKTGKYDIKTVDKWLRKHRKNYKINVNSIQ